MRQRHRVVAAVVLVALAVTAAVAVRTAGTEAVRTAKSTFDARKEALFERGREAGRRGPANPAAEQVENRAYPRNYVDDGRAAVSRKEFSAKAHKPAADAFGA